MYHPAAPTAAEQAAGFTNEDDFEFLELYNRSAIAADAEQFLHWRRRRLHLRLVSPTARQRSLDAGIGGHRHLVGRRSVQRQLHGLRPFQPGGRQRQPPHQSRPRRPVHDHLRRRFDHGHRRSESDQRGGQRRLGQFGRLFVQRAGHRHAHPRRHRPERLDARRLGQVLGGRPRATWSWAARRSIPFRSAAA